MTDARRMSNSGSTARRTPWWILLVSLYASLNIGSELARRRGAALGITVGTLIGSMAVLSVSPWWAPVAVWSGRHPGVKNLLWLPAVFVALADFTKLHLGICLLVTVAVGVVLAGLRTVAGKGALAHRERYRSSEGAEPPPANADDGGECRCEACAAGGCVWRDHDAGTS